VTPLPDTTLKELMDNSAQFPRYFQLWNCRKQKCPERGVGPRVKQCMLNPSLIFVGAREVKKRKGKKKAGNLQI
jgi:hypothetical protein